MAFPSRGKRFEELVGQAIFSSNRGKFSQMFDQKEANKIKEKYGK